MQIIKIVFLLQFFNVFVSSYLLNYNLTKMFTVGDNSSYFGYSLLLQKGNPSFVIVGAPKRMQNFYNTGAVFRCDLSLLICREFTSDSRIRGVYPPSKNGDFFGSVIVGDDTTSGSFFSCAPRFVFKDNRGEYFTNGRCYHFDGMTVNTFLPLSAERQISTTTIQEHRVIYYDAAYGEAGFAISYLKDQNKLLIGSPGKSLGMGAMVRTNTHSYRSELLAMPDLLFKYQDNYFGYAVAWGRFHLSSERIFYLAGGPRGDDLKGSVIFFDQDGRLSKEHLTGEEIGSFFGASLLVIDNKGNGDDLLVGAPMFSGITFEEGCVYFYKNNNGVLHLPVKLLNNKFASRFGTTMAAIGDIDLDSFSDCAIAAPYEDDGTGAVYIYFGSKIGFSNNKFYRISPSHFAKLYPNVVIKGFGMGLSNGNDIDNNKHNDIAIGAYKSGQIFYFSTNQIFDVRMNVTSDVDILYTSTSGFMLNYCLEFSFRNEEQSSKIVFRTFVTLDDDRIINRQNISKVITLKPNHLSCMSEKVLLKKDHLNLEPLIISYGYQKYDSQDALIEDVLTIPVLYECGSDNICETNLTVKSATSNIPKIVFGVNNEVKVKVNVSNTGESAYQTKLYLKVLPEVSLINLRECYIENNSYVCVIAPVLHDKIEKTFIFDLANLPPNIKSVPINFTVDSIGRNVNPFNTFELNIPVDFQSNLHLESRSLPENIVLNKSEKLLTISHTYIIGNQGPSPFDLNLTILVPQKIVNGSQIPEISSVEGNVDGIDSTCTNVGNFVNLSKIQQENDTAISSCADLSKECIHIVCKAGYLPKSNKNAIFNLKLTLHVGPTMLLFKDSRRKLFFNSSAYFTNDTARFFSSASTMIFVLYDDSVIPLWIYIVSVGAGLILLLILIYTLYKCNFFKRTYKKMLETEKYDQKQHDKCQRKMSIATMAAQKHNFDSEIHGYKPAKHKH